MPFIFTKKTGGVISLDEKDAATSITQLNAYIDERESAAVEPVQADLDAAKTELGAATSALVGEIVRLRRLKKADLDVEKTTKHLSTFTVAQLVVELGQAKALFKEDEIPSGGSETEERVPDDPDQVKKLGADKPNPYLARKKTEAKAA